MQLEFILLGVTVKYTSSKIYPVMTTDPDPLLVYCTNSATSPIPSDVAVTSKDNFSHKARCCQLSLCTNYERK